MISCMDLSIRRSTPRSCTHAMGEICAFVRLLLLVKDLLLIATRLIALIVGVGIPVFLTLAQHLPFASTLSNKLAPYLSSSIYRDYNIRTLPY